jgi:hypothetical protein
MPSTLHCSQACNIIVVPEPMTSSIPRRPHPQRCRPHWACDTIDFTISPSPRCRRPRAIPESTTSSSSPSLHRPEIATLHCIFFYISLGIPILNFMCYISTLLWYATMIWYVTHCYIVLIWYTLLTWMWICFMLFEAEISVVWYYWIHVVIYVKDLRTLDDH